MQAYANPAFGRGFCTGELQNKLFGRTNRRILSFSVVIFTRAGIQNVGMKKLFSSTISEGTSLDSRLRGNDGKEKYLGCK